MSIFIELFQQGKFIKSSNATFIVLILKKLGAVKLKVFCPISLLGSVYKILVKMLANMLKIMLKKIISPSRMPL